MLRRAPVALSLCLMVVLLTVSGCGGCRWNWFSRSSDPAKEEPAVKEKPKPDFDRPRLVFQPSDAVADGSGAILQLAKPGHWASATLEMKANNFDFTGELNSEIVAGNGEPVELERTSFRLGTSRPAALTKGQKKFLEMTLFMPPKERQPQLDIRLRSRTGGDVIGMLPEPIGRMPAYQYFFFVAARTPERYTFLKHLDSIRPPGDQTVLYYRVVAPTIEKRVPLPTNPLTWSSIAFLLWDDVEPAAFDPEQQQALIDWLHWGGQLIISGPDTLDGLKGSFLEPYLPASSDGTRTLAATDLAPLSDAWTLDDVKANQRRPGAPLAIAKPWVGVKLQPLEDAEYVSDTGNLLVERRVGRGRIVASAFRLHERDLLAWPGFDGFVNACLLRHPPRRFRDGKLSDLQVSWSGSTDFGRDFDPALMTGVRYLARDAGFSYQRPATRPGPASFDIDGDDEGTGASLGQWSDFNPVSKAARSSLREAAGIEIPKPRFVLWSLALYLAVLVPLNWLVFRLMGRVEWAWFAAPVIALAGTVVVTRSAHLDIGFTRSQREIALVEMHTGYPRAHAARYTALYTSLSTTYDLHFTDPGALVQPFSADVQRVMGQAATKVSYRRDEDVQLSGFPVSSNSTGMVHSEHMVNLGGGVSLAGSGDKQRLVNQSRLNLLDAAVVRRLPDDVWELAWIGELGAGDSCPIDFTALSPTEMADRWRTSLTGSAAQHPEAASLRHVVDLLAETKDLRPGDTRLTAWTPDELPGLRVAPPAPQSQHATLIVAHLTHAPLPAPQRDDNTRASISAAAGRLFESFEPADAAPDSTTKPSTPEAP